MGSKSASSRPGRPPARLASREPAAGGTPTATTTSLSSRNLSLPGSKASHSPPPLLHADPTREFASGESPHGVRRQPSNSRTPQPRLNALPSASAPPRRLPSQAGESAAGWTPLGDANSSPPCSPEGESPSPAGLLTRVGTASASTDALAHPQGSRNGAQAPLAQSRRTRAPTSRRAPAPERIFAQIYTTWFPHVVYPTPFRGGLG